MKFLLSFPVFISFLLLFALVALHYQRKRWAYCLIISAIISNYLFATPLMTQIIFVIIGKYPPLSVQQIIQQQPQAIVILGGGLYRGGEYNNQYQSGGASTARLQYGAYVAKQTRLPIALSGMEVAYGMSNTLGQFGLAATWLENNSYDTHENAQFSAQLLIKNNIQKIVLVTDAWHMSRSVLAFRQAGFNVIPAPTEFPDGFYVNQKRWWQADLHTYTQNLRGWSEIFGHVKYRVRYALFSKA